MDIAIPYNVEERPDTGVYNAKLGIWLFLASEVMLFGALFSSYILLRSGNPNWPVGELNPLASSVKVALINTIILIASSVTVIFSWLSLKERDLNKFRRYMLLTCLGAVLFLVNKYFEYAHHFHLGEVPAKSTFFGLYFTMTGLHVLHVIGGLIVNLYFASVGCKMWETEPERFTNRIEVAGLYWHFVDLVWIFLFPVLYLL